jgi:DNA-binding NarL/FixJ family response regulator
LTESIRVLLADDHPLVRAGIRATLLAEGGVELVGEATTGDEAQQLCRELAPDVLLLDLNMPGPAPVELMALLREACPVTRVLVLTAYDDDAYVRAVAGAGAAGYVLKDDATEALVRAIRAVMQGDTWFSHTIMERLVRGDPRPAPPTAEAPPLTNRELEVLHLVVDGKTNQEIAIVLGISTKTVEKHLGEIFTRLGVASRVEAAVQAVRGGLV